MTLTAVITSAPEGGYVALNPETGTTTQGETVAEALENLKQATQLYVSFALRRPGLTDYFRGCCCLTKLPRISGQKCVRTLHRLGFATIRQRGSHVILRLGDRGCVSSLHRELKIGILHGILKQGEVTLTEFVAALRP